MEVRRRGGVPRREGSVRGITYESSIKPRGDRVNGRQEGVDHGVEILMPDGGQDFQMDAVILQLARRDVVRAAINGHVMTAGYESC